MRPDGIVVEFTVLLVGPGLDCPGVLAHHCDAYMPPAVRTNGDTGDDRRLVRGEALLAADAKGEEPPV